MKRNFVYLIFKLKEIEILKVSYSETEYFQDFASCIVTATGTTKIYFFVPDRNVLWCKALD